MNEKIYNKPRSTGKTFSRRVDKELLELTDSLFTEHDQIEEKFEWCLTNDLIK